MRLWHQKLIKYLPNQQILGLHREICGLRGNGWGRKHSTVDYVFTHPFEWLVAYHFEVIVEMMNRGFNVDETWSNTRYRGKKCGEADIDVTIIEEKSRASNEGNVIYPEHDDAYLQECLDNLKGKGIEIKME